MRRAILDMAVLALGLAVIAPADARAEGPPAGDWTGRRVIPRSGALALHDDRGEVAGIGGAGRVYRVEQAEGDRLRLRGEGREQAGWVSADDVVAAPPPIDPAVRPAASGPELTALTRSIEVQACLRYAGAAIREKDLDRAIADCDRAIRWNPKEAEAYYLRGSARAMKDEMARAVRPDRGDPARS